nr:MAG TPA: hypothetical protein [Bacteriophage sp.]
MLKSEDHDLYSRRSGATFKDATGDHVYPALLLIFFEYSLTTRINQSLLPKY